MSEKPTIKTKPLIDIGDVLNKINQQINPQKGSKFFGEDYGLSSSAESGMKYVWREKALLPNVYGKDAEYNVKER